MPQTADASEPSSCLSGVAKCLSMQHVDSQQHKEKVITGTTKLAHAVATMVAAADRQHALLLASPIAAAAGYSPE